MLKKGELFSSVLKSEMGIMLKKHKECDNVKVIRFEDLKYKPEKTMKSLCHWLDIPYRSILLSKWNFNIFSDIYERWCEIYYW